MRNRSRREFIQMGAALGVMAGLTPRAHAAEKPGGKMRWGLVTYQWGRDWDLPTLLRNCETARTYGVELRTTHAHGVEPGLDANQRAEVRRRFEDSPVTLVGIGSDERLDNPDPAVLAKAMDAARAFVRLSHDVGGSGVKVKPNDFHEGTPREQTIEQIGKALNELGAFGADYGQQIRLEAHGKEFSELPIFKQVMDIADHPNVAVCWNSNQNDLKGEGLEYNFNLVKARLGQTTHVRELDTEEYPFQRLIELLVAMDYDGWVMLEASRDPGDRVAALARQSALFGEMVAKARAAFPAG